MPDAVGPLEIRADLRSRQTFVSVSISAPREGRAKGRTNWLLRQLRDAPDDLLVEARFPNVKTTTVSKLADARADPLPLFYPADPRREPREFSVTRARPMGQKRGRAEGSFVRETSGQTVAFYHDVVQNLKPWRPAPPKLHVTGDGQADEPEDDRPVTPAWAEDRSLNSSGEIGDDTDPAQRTPTIALGDIE